MHTYGLIITIHQTSYLANNVRHVQRISLFSRGLTLGSLVNATLFNIESDFHRLYGSLVHTEVVTRLGRNNHLALVVTRSVEEMSCHFLMRHHDQFVTFRLMMNLHYRIMRIYRTLSTMVFRLAQLHHFRYVSTLLVLSLPVRGSYLFRVYFRLIVMGHSDLLRILLHLVGTRFVNNHPTFPRRNIVDNMPFRTSSLCTGRSDRDS